MNINRVADIVFDVNFAIKNDGLVSRLKDLATALEDSAQGIVEGADDSYSTLYSSLVADLTNCATNDFPPSKRLILKALKLDGIVGVGLRNEIKNRLNTANIAPTASVTSLQELMAVVQTKYEVTEKATSSFSALGIEMEYLKAGEHEIGIVLPENMTNMSLEQISKEAEWIDRTIKLFGEITNDRPAEVTVKSIGASDLMLYLVAANGIAYAFAKTIDKIMDICKKAYEIKLVKKQLSMLGAPEKITEETTEWEEATGDNDLKSLATSVVEEHYTADDEGRKNELKNQLYSELKTLARLIEKGAMFEVHTCVEDEPEEDTASSEEDHTRMVNEWKERIKTSLDMNVKGRSMLQIFDNNLEIKLLPDLTETPVEDNQNTDMD